MKNFEIARTDTHFLDHLDMLNLGVATVWRTWLGLAHVMNTWSLTQLIPWDRPALGEPPESLDAYLGGWDS